MKHLYQFDSKSLEYKRVRVSLTRKFSSVFILSSLFFSLGYFLGNVGRNPYFLQNHQKPLELIIGSVEWKDSVFTDYEMRAELYLGDFPDTPIESGMLRLAAYNAYDSTGVLLPVELALAQAQMESSMGTRGRSPKNNPFNVGEYDSGTVKWMASTYEGVESYYFLMCQNYLRCKDLSILFKNFVNCNGHRYASSPNYESTIKKQFNYIKKNINKKISSDIPK